jgi:hypothetical protein
MIGVDDGDAVLEGAHRHDLLGDDEGVRPLGLRRRNEDDIGALERKAAHGFRKLHVVANEHPELQTGEFHHVRRGVAGREERAFIVAIEMAFAVDAEPS